MFYRNRKGIYCKKPQDVIAKKRKSVYGIFCVDKKILVIKPNWHNLWEFPGGGLEKEENIHDAIKREFLEETGFEIIKYKKKPIFIANMHFFADDINQYFDSELYFFIIINIKKKNVKKDDYEINESSFISVEDIIKNRNMHEVHLNCLKEVVKYL